MDDFTALKQSFLLCGLNVEEQNEAISILSPQISEHAKGDVLASVGDRVCSLRFIARGSASVFRDSEHKVLLNRLDVGDCFGVANLFSDETTYPTEIVADSAVFCINVSEAQLISLFSAKPTSALNYISFLSDKIRFLNKRIGDFSCGSAEKKVVRLLLLSSEQNQILTLGNLSETAEQLGLGRASLYRVLSDLETRGLISKDRKTITILNLNELKGILS